jgi:MYXO-CTERM domain-containing protein
LGRQSEAVVFAAIAEVAAAAVEPWVAFVSRRGLAFAASMAVSWRERSGSGTWLLLAALALVAGLGATARAANICTETVPTNRFIDGFPAYAQCTASTNSAIYSDNGIDTATASGGTGWVRTQGSNGYQCTELAHRYLYFKWNVQSVPNGNAGVWCDATIPNGLLKVTTPVHGDLIVFAPGSCGADSVTGHVAVIDTVNADASVTAVQQNSAGRSKYKLTCAACFLHATANEGTVGDGGASDGAALNDAGAAGKAGASGAGGFVGAAGAGGVAGRAGTGGVTGSAGTGGAVSSGAAAAGGTTGVAGAGGVGAGATPDASGGCACRLADGQGSGGRDGRGDLVALFALFGLAAIRRRRS